MDRHRLRLGTLVRQRRRKLELRQKDLRPLGGPSAETVRLIENGTWTVNNPQDDTLDGLDVALGWRIGSCRSILAGGEPMEADSIAARAATEALEGWASSQALEAGWCAVPRWMVSDLVAVASELSLQTRGMGNEVGETATRIHTLASDILALVMASERSPAELAKLLKRLEQVS
ncbi:hypothetical protein ACFVUS_12715 [Nocardia sp. NPDC058058]|uniref:hypothetical protein n=1 Tax=Nocardia sp. NPDC058058 TaxID=3346317 RepID=UPI0036DD705E